MPLSWLSRDRRVRSSALVSQADVYYRGIEQRLTAMAETYELVMWANGLHYVEDLLASFDLPVITIAESKNATTPHVGMRHDCDWSIENALAMATVEAEVGARSTYFLLHPDGFVQKRNYAGHIDGTNLIINPGVFGIAKRFTDLGHEIGLHNDIITLALFLKRPPAELLGEILRAFRKNGVEITGMAGHGNRMCKELGYANYQLFDECKDMSVSDAFRGPNVAHEGYSIEKYSLKMSDFGLAYEAGNMATVHKAVYLSDSGGRLSLSDHSHHIRGRLDAEIIQSSSKGDEVASALEQCFALARVHGMIQCLVHADHWSPIVNFNPRTRDRIRRERDARAKMKRDRRAGRPPDNLLFVRENATFATYDRSYTENERHFRLPDTLRRFGRTFFGGERWSEARIIEVGAGQGEFLDLIRQHAGEEVGRTHAVCLGVEGSAVGVRQAAVNYPHCYWIGDSIQSFFADRAAGAYSAYPWLKSFSAVVDKTGATSLTREDEARKYFADVYRALDRHGCYVYIASKSFYDQKMVPNYFKDWSVDWMTLATASFDRVEVHDDPGANEGYYKRVFWRDR